MDLKSQTSSSLEDATHKSVLWDRKAGEDAEHEGEKMYITVKSEHSPEYKTALNRQINFNAKAGDKDFDIDEEYQATARLRTAITAECHIFYDGKWVTKKATSTAQEKDQADKKLREIYRELPDMMAMVKTHSSNDMNFLPASEDGSLIEHDNSPG